MEAVSPTMTQMSFVGTCFMRLVCNLKVQNETFSVVEVLQPHESPKPFLWFKLQFGLLRDLPVLL